MTLKPRFSFLLIFLAGMIPLSVGGCAPVLPTDLPPIHPCKIHLVQEGKPFPDAVVTLIQSEKAASPGAQNGQVWFPMGTTDHNGVAVIFTNSRYDGAPLGRFKVVVVKQISGESKLGLPPPEGTPERDKWEEARLSETLPLFTLAEPQYTDAGKTPLEIEVKKGKNSFNLDIGKACKIKMQ